VSDRGFVAHDGGRRRAGYRGQASDCVVRAVAIASGRPYGEIYKALAEEAQAERYMRGRAGFHAACGRGSSPRTGIKTSLPWFKSLMESWGFTWTATMRIGSGCKVHLRPEELPAGRMVVSLSKHYTAVIDGVVYDTHDPRRDGTRCVYGYWLLA
jgi:hypothetical protein